MPPARIPLLSEHKTLFVWNRLLETLLGGIRLYIGSKVPIYVYAVQIIAHQIPFIVGLLFTLLVELCALSYVTASCSCGAVVTLSVACIQLTVLYLQRNTTVTQNLGQSGPKGDKTVVRNTALDEEDAVSFRSCFSAETAALLFPKRKFALSAVLHTTLSGILAGYGLVYFLPSRLNRMYSSVGFSCAIFALGWFALCVALYSLTVHPPPETATFHPLDRWEIKPLMRPFYVILCFAADVANWFTPACATLNAVMHIVFVFLPTIWFLNLLPPLEALLLWTLEQIQVWIAGGSPTSSLTRLFVYLLLWCCSVLLVFLGQPACAQQVIGALLGCILSLDLDLWRRFCVPGCLRKRKQNPDRKSQAFLSWSCSDVSYFVLMLALTLAVILLVHFTLKPTSEANRTLMTCFDFVLPALFLISKICSNCQMVYVCNGLVRNRLYPPNIIKISDFAAKQARLDKIGNIWSILNNGAVPLILVAYVAVLQEFGCCCCPLPSSDLALFSLWKCIAGFRAYRWPWQQTDSALFEFMVVHFISRCFATFSAQNVTTLLLLAAVLSDRLCNFIHKLHTFGVVLVSSVAQEKQRRTNSWLMFTLNLVFLPFIIGILLLSAALNAPLLPLFTLPVFWLGFPRPVAFWPKQSENHALSQDSVYYEEVTPQLVRKLGSVVAGGGLGRVRPGDEFLLRYDDRLIWLSISEKGYGFARVVIKGLELQQTSCHAVEATAVDAILERAFETDLGEVNNGRRVSCQLNRTPMHIYQPLLSVLIETYVDSRNVLTGVITSPETLLSIADYFPKCLIWVLLLHYRKPDIPAAECRPKTPSSGQVDKLGATSRPSTADRYAKLTKVASGVDLSDDPWLDEDDPLDSLTASVESKSSVDVHSFMNLLKNEPSPVVPFGSVPLPGSIDCDNPEDAVSTVNIRSPQKKPELARKVSLDVCQYTGCFPAEWMRSPVLLDAISSIDSLFPSKWYAFLVEQRSADRSSMEEKEYRRLILTCHSVINQVTASGKVPIVSPNLVHRIFNREPPWSPLADWLLQNESLYDLVIKAYRYACKLALDQALIGDIESEDDLMKCLQEYDDSWFIGPDNDPSWTESIKGHVPNLFSLGYNSTMGIYTSHLLSRRFVPVHIGRLNREAVRAVWTTLSLELLYLTNDDEERYSIQAHSGLLRNLTVQGADPPLGYPVYMSQPLLVKVTPSLSM